MWGNVKVRMLMTVTNSFTFSIERSTNGLNGAVDHHSDLTASDFGDYQEVLAVHAEGSLEAEKLQTYREYDFESAAAYARALAGVTRVWL